MYSGIEYFGIDVRGAAFGFLIEDIGFEYSSSCKAINFLNSCPVTLLYSSKVRVTMTSCMYLILSCFIFFCNKKITCMNISQSPVNQILIIIDHNIPELFTLKKIFECQMDNRGFEIFHSIVSVTS